MKKALIASILLLIMNTQCITVQALGLGSVQASNISSLMFTLKDIGNTDNKIKDTVTNLNKDEDVKQYTTIKNNVYNQLSDYMKIKYSLYNIYIVNNIQDIPIYNDKPDTTLGYIEYNSKYILLENNTKYRSVESLLMHELGHALDTYDELDNYPTRESGKYSNTEAFKKISDKEKYDLQNLTDILFFTSNIREYFAESYVIYMQNPSEMKKVAPETYTFMNNVVNQNIIGSLE